MRKKLFIIILLISSGLFITAFRNQPPSPQSNLLLSVVAKLKNNTNWYPKQKAYLHTDKSRYHVSDRLWFKAYLIDAGSHLPDKLSSNLYVELINPGGYIVQTKLLKITNGTARGDFSFQDTIPEGRYLLRAYTNWMRNAGEDFYFQKHLYIKNPFYKNFATREDVQIVKKSIRKSEKKALKYHISFHPEGGALLSGVENIVAFKAINDLGESIKISGELYDSKKNLILSTESIHAGMGSFKFTPIASEKYVFRLKTGGKVKSFELPESIPMGVNIKVSHLDSDSIVVDLLSNINPADFPPNTVYYLLAHTREKVRFTGTIDLSNPKSLRFPKYLFPDGICHLTLFNYRSSAISERLIFIKNTVDPVVSVSLPSHKFSKRQKASAQITVNDLKGTRVNGNFSMAVVRKNQYNPNENIVSCLLLDSDLKSYVENPAYYFTNTNSQKEKELDLLMMTQGWKRFLWSDVILDKKLPPKYTIEEKIEIGGQITKEFFNIPLSDILVRLTIMDEYNEVYTTRTNSGGYFVFKNLDFQDTLRVKIEANRKNGKKNLLIIVDNNWRSKLKTFNYITEQYLKKPGEEGRLVNLPMEEDPEKDDPFYEENNRYHRIHQEPSTVIKVDDNMQQYQNVAQILQGRVPGVNVHGNSINIRGISSFYGNQDPLYVVDGIPVDAGTALSINPHDIDQIEILKGPEASIYGSRGANGVIIIYTKRGKYMLKGVLEFDMLAYHTPAEFYSPKYEINPDEEFFDDRSTLLWVPELNFDEKGLATISFYTSDLASEYIVVIEGIDTEGHPIVHLKNFLVE
ncbi:MAG: TonB-dependent receptor plug domain-containing protein [Bacteroidales bacterium]|nr:TonB-dependent receptor plug domain-containing protein [Bacteroidales bacterium]MCF8391555.1 TonB-dependent receptor plug domain-containing protein [Bacteroidales bacterium]